MCIHSERMLFADTDRSDVKQKKPSRIEFFGVTHTFVISITGRSRDSSPLSLSAESAGPGERAR